MCKLNPTFLVTKRASSHQNAVQETQDPGTFPIPDSERIALAADISIHTPNAMGLPAPGYMVQ